MSDTLSLDYAEFSFCKAAKYNMALNSRLILKTNLKIKIQQKLWAGKNENRYRNDNNVHNRKLCNDDKRRVELERM